jgi:hypothetical protein
MQEQTEKTMAPDKVLTDGKVRPKSKVKVLFLNSAFHGVPFFVDEVHPSLAEKLIATGKAEMAKGELTKAQKDANKKALKDRASEQGRTAIIADDKADADFDDDMLGTGKGK